MFIGEYRHNLDAKGRIIVPAKFREQLTNNIILTRGLDGCITVYTLEQWQEIYKELKKLPTTKRESRMYIHMLTAKAAEVEIDRQGRILIPAPLIEAAKIEKESVIVGAFDHIEIWSNEAWDKYYAEASDSFEDIAESLTDFIS
ncbi:MAG: division/cell wall cluster transcriptional repressor MraZ [Erysipelothrix sp.]|nr:division/cell wall cluster transcriptional repressor MraZ [Erysipelothrix sp.]